MQLNLTGGLNLTIDLKNGVCHYSGVEYAHNGIRTLLADIFMPEHDEGEYIPLLIWVHGGGWRSGGTREDWPGILRQLGRGYAVMSIEYTLTGSGPDNAPFPIQIKDVKASVKWARKNAHEFGWDPTRIGIGGISAGGHLAALAGCTNGMREFEHGNIHEGYSSEVQAVVDIMGPSDLSMHHKDTISDDGRKVIERLVDYGSCDLEERLRHASPITYIDGTEPPFLIIHGAKDTLVNVRQSEILHNKLIKRG
jgi:acetyl esterase/lipase